MNIKTTRVTIMLLLTGCFSMTVGCGSFEFGHRLEFGPDWVSVAGKSQEEFQRDQAECKREISLGSTPAFSPGPGGSAGFDMDDIKAFESCMRARGWVRE